MPVAQLWPLVKFCFDRPLNQRLTPKKEAVAKTASGNPRLEVAYSVDSISNPQASRSGSGMYLEFLLRRAHSRSRVERKY